MVEEFKEKCWDIKNEVDEEFKDIIEGFRNSNDKLMKKYIGASRNMEWRLKSIDELKQKRNLYMTGQWRKLISINQSYLMKR
ncbi:hypothetical protein V3595_10765 [Bacillus sp. CFBP9009]